jgi:hypothetical protein
MDKEDFKIKIKSVVEKATSLKNKYIQEKSKVNYACLFSQNKEEYKELTEAAKKIGKIIVDTHTGPIFQIESLQTSSGILRLLKIRIPDPTRPEKGDADFTIPNFSEFRKKYLNKTGFKLIEREEYIMIELLDSEFDVRAYFSNPTLEEQLDIH